MELPIIKLEDINFIYNKGKSNEFLALKNVGLEIFPGEFVAVFGPSGCGKSTLLYTISGVEKPQTGKVIVQGRNLLELSAEQLAFYRQMGIGIIFQNFNLIPSIKNIENVTLPMSFIGISIARRQKRAMELLERLGIAELANRFPHELSGGQQQRVAIARALANDPPILLADEPIGNLDSNNSKIVLKLLKEICVKEGKTVIMVTHQAWTLRECNRIFYMKDGEIINIEGKTKRTIEAVKKIGSSYYYQKLFSGLPRSKVYAQILADSFFRGHPSQEIARLEEIIYTRLRKEIDEEAFKILLDKPYKEGGAGLWKQSIDNVSKIVENIIKKRSELKLIYKRLEKNPEYPLFEKVSRMQNWLLDDYKASLSAIQHERLREVISDRIRNVILPEHFVKVLDLPISEGGVGFKIGYAMKVGEKLEVILGRKEIRE